jgi:hypothetical protein
MNRDYSKSKIYKIVDYSTNNIYVGSTLKTLSNRLAQHRSTYKVYLNGKYHYVTSFKVLENNNYRIELIENYPECTSIEELHKREGEWIQRLDCVNKCVAGRTQKEYQEANKDKIKEYRKANKDKIKESGKEYYKANKDKIKEYREANKDKMKEYREANKDKIKERMNKVHKCICGKEFKYGNKQGHFKTIFHTEFIEKEKQWLKDKIEELNRTD